MRYYDTAIKIIEIVYITGIGNYKTENHTQIEITKETTKFIYGISWNGRYKYDKQKKQWYKYEHYCWEELKLI